MSDVTIRPATLADIGAMSRVLTASIRELCAADHRGDPEILAGWTRNKTPVGVAAMLANPQMTFYLAERQGDVAAVGCIDAHDGIRLNYVAPAHRFMGVSKALLAAMEAALKARGTLVASLDSTTTAHRFYIAAGWHDTGPPTDTHAVPAYPMQKRL